MKRAAFFAASFLLVAVAMAIATRRAVPALGDRIARRLLSVTSVLPAPPERSSPRGDVPPWARGEREAVASGASGAGTTRDGGDAPPPGSIAVHVPASLVQRAIYEEGRTISARTQREPDGGGAGIRLTGVTQLRLGLQDGDIVVSVEGEPTPDRDTATDIALGVIARGASVLHARAMRGDQLVSITADLPPVPIAQPE
ncbi:MAG: hypothetical protein ACLQVI_04265 [Polyangiaceae bacterium]